MKSATWWSWTTADSSFRPTMWTLPYGCLLRGVYKLKDRLLLVLDTARATEIVPAATGAANRSQNDAKTE